ncbi:MAG TPA: UPF0147 family protein [Thermoplasmata archaeon]|nr:UPF0147 family protein [Thermoplasmata archaeon]
MAAPETGAQPADGGTPSKTLEFARIIASLDQLAEDNSVPRNIRRGAVSARDELSKARTALDLRVASAVYVLDDLANDPNLPTHGRTAIWSIISSLESFQ